MPNNDHSHDSYNHSQFYNLSSAAIGRRIRECRKSRHMTQEELASRLGVSSSYISFLESGKRPLTHPVTMSLLRILNVSYNYLVLGQADEVMIDAVYEPGTYLERLKFEQLLEHCTKSEYEMCYQLCNAYLTTARSNNPHQQKPLPPTKNFFN